MGLPRTFVGFSSTDIRYYYLMLAWKKNEGIDFNFTDCQLHKAVNSNNEAYVKRVVRSRINMAAKYIMLIGKDTRYKYKYVRWEAEVAIEKGCTIIGVNLDGSRRMVEGTCPPVIRDIGAVFVSFWPKIVGCALQDYTMFDSGSRHYREGVYQRLRI